MVPNNACSCVPVIVWPVSMMILRPAKVAGAVPAVTFCAATSRLPSGRIVSEFVVPSLTVPTVVAVATEVGVEPTKVLT